MIISFVGNHLFYKALEMKILFFELLLLFTLCVFGNRVVNDQHRPNIYNDEFYQPQFNSFQNPTSYFYDYADPNLDPSRPNIDTYRQDKRVNFWQHGRDADRQFINYDKNQRIRLLSLKHSRTNQDTNPEMHVPSKDLTVFGASAHQTAENINAVFGNVNLNKMDQSRINNDQNIGIEQTDKGLIHKSNSYAFTKDQSASDKEQIWAKETDTNKHAAQQTNKDNLGNHIKSNNDQPEEIEFGKKELEKQTAGVPDMSLSINAPKDKNLHAQNSKEFNENKKANSQLKPLSNDPEERKQQNKERARIHFIADSPPVTEAETVKETTPHEVISQTTESLKNNLKVSGAKNDYSEEEIKTDDKINVSVDEKIVLNVFKDKDGKLRVEVSSAKIDKHTDVVSEPVKTEVKNVVDARPEISTDKTFDEKGKDYENNKLINREFKPASFNAHNFNLRPFEAQPNLAYRYNYLPYQHQLPLYYPQYSHSQNNNPNWNHYQKYEQVAPQNVWSDDTNHERNPLNRAKSANAFQFQQASNFASRDSPDSGKQTIVASQQPSKQLHESQKSESKVTLHSYSELKGSDYFKNKCTPRKCPNTCKSGIRKFDLVSGCSTCDCCEVIDCYEYCEHGYEADKYGCPICECVEILEESLEIIM